MKRIFLKLFIVICVFHFCTESFARNLDFIEESRRFADADNYRKVWLTLYKGIEKCKSENYTFKPSEKEEICSLLTKFPTQYYIKAAMIVWHIDNCACVDGVVQAMSGRIKRKDPEALLLAGYLYHRSVTVTDYKGISKEKKITIQSQYYLKGKKYLDIFYGVYRDKLDPYKYRLDDFDYKYADMLLAAGEIEKALNVVEKYRGARHLECLLRGGYKNIINNEEISSKFPDKILERYERAIKKDPNNWELYASGGYAINYSNTLTKEEKLNKGIEYAVKGSKILRKALRDKRFPSRANLRGYTPPWILSLALQNKEECDAEDVILFMKVADPLKVRLPDHILKKMSPSEKEKCIGKLTELSKNYTNKDVLFSVIQELAVHVNDFDTVEKYFKIQIKQPGVDIPKAYADMIERYQEFFKDVRRKEPNFIEKKAALKKKIFDTTASFINIVVKEILDGRRRITRDTWCGVFRDLFWVNYKGHIHFYRGADVTLLSDVSLLFDCLEDNYDLAVQRRNKQMQQEIFRVYTELAKDLKELDRLEGFMKETGIQNTGAVVLSLFNKGEYDKAMEKLKEIKDQHQKDEIRSAISRIYRKRIKELVRKLPQSLDRRRAKEKSFIELNQKIMDMCFNPPEGLCTDYVYINRLESYINQYGFVFAGRYFDPKMEKFNAKMKEQIAAKGEDAALYYIWGLGYYYRSGTGRGWGGIFYTGKKRENENYLIKAKEYLDKAVQFKYTMNYRDYAKKRMERRINKTYAEVKAIIEKKETLKKEKE